MGLARNEFGWTFTNAKMEAGNDVAQTMIDAAYGYHNFERFRKRFLLMRRNKKK
jgi:transposase